MRLGLGRLAYVVEDFDYAVLDVVGLSEEYGSLTYDLSNQMFCPSDFVQVCFGVLFQTMWVCSTSHKIPTRYNIIDHLITRIGKS